jgi:hypothetical protein
LPCAVGQLEADPQEDQDPDRGRRPLSDGFRSRGGGGTVRLPVLDQEGDEQHGEQNHDRDLHERADVRSPLADAERHDRDPTVTRMKIRLTTISPVVPSGLLSTKEFSAAMVVAVSVPSQMGSTANKGSRSPRLPGGRTPSAPTRRPALDRERRADLGGDHPVREEEHDQRDDQPGDRLGAGLRRGREAVQRPLSRRR